MFKRIIGGVLFCAMFVSCIMLPDNARCAASLAGSLANGDGGILLRMLKQACSRDWKECIPLLDPTSSVNDIMAMHGINEYVAIQCGELSCISSNIFRTLGKPFLWGCDKEGKPFIAVIYDVYTLGGSVVARGVIQTFVQAQADKPGIWISRAHRGREKFIRHMHALCDDAAQEEEVNFNEFQTLAKLMLDGEVVVKHQKTGFVKLAFVSLWNDIRLFNASYKS